MLQVHPGGIALLRSRHLNKDICFPCACKLRYFVQDYNTETETPYVDFWIPLSYMFFSQTP